MSNHETTKARFDTLKSTQETLLSTIEEAQASLAVVEGEMDRAAQAWAQETGGLAEELF